MLQTEKELKKTQISWLKIDKQQLNKSLDEKIESKLYNNSFKTKSWVVLEKELLHLNWKPIIWFTNLNN